VQGLRILAVREGSTLIEFRVDDDHRLRSWWDFSIRVGGKEKGEIGVLFEEHEEWWQEEEQWKPR